MNRKATMKELFGKKKAKLIKKHCKAWNRYVRYNRLLEAYES